MSKKFEAVKCIRERFGFENQTVAGETYLLDTASISGTEDEAYGEIYSQGMDASEIEDAVEPAFIARLDLKRFERLQKK